MSLQRRLTLFFVLIVILPLAAAGFIVQRVISDEVGRRAVLSIRPAMNVTIAIYNDLATSLERRIRLSADGDRQLGRLVSGGSRSDFDAYLASKLRGLEGVDFLLVHRGEKIMGFASTKGEFIEGYAEPTPSQIAATNGVGPGFSRSAPVHLTGFQGRQVADLVGGFWLDRELLAAGSGNEVGLSVASRGQIIASTLPLIESPSVRVQYDEPFTVDIDSPSQAVATQLGRGATVIASTPTGPLDTTSRRVLTAMLLLLLFALVTTTGLAYLLARLITQPLDELARGAEAISEGQFDHKIPVRSRDEVGQLAMAFNEMTSRLTTNITELSSSRDQLRRAIQRVGETLRSTHDMKQLLESILNTAADALRADAAIFWAFSPARDELYPSITRGVDIDSLVRIGIGEGAVGLVAERATNILIPAEPGGPRFSRHEPRFPVAIAVPLYGQDRMTGVLALYRNDPRKHFGRADLDMVNFLAEQGSTAIENVLLHEEAQRLSITDGLTGIWNRRYFQMQFRQVLATATRFDRRFSVLMLDLDHFKRVNDTYGHRQGDAILIEFAERVTTMVREVDTFARYGGEEFACLLTETDLEGAMTTAEKILDAVRREPYVLSDGTALNLTVSIGIASYPDHGESSTSLVEAADRALYRAKQTGRNQACVAERLRLAT